MSRTCGILLPVSSLPSDYGIGCFSGEAFDFIDFLVSAGQSCWQILPTGQTGYGDSPYQSFSTFAGNPYFIDLGELIDLGYITRKEADACNFGTEPMYVDYGQLYANRYPLLRKAYERSPFVCGYAGTDPVTAEFERFAESNEAWLPDFALFCAVKNYFGGKSFIEWEDDIRLREPAAMEHYREMLAEDVRFYEFLQFFFDRQWKKVKTYAAEKGIKIIGDIPIYVAFDSADTWSHPELFELDEKGYPTVVAGCPPDAFSATGQLWGNPIYRWDYHKETGYAWWLRRLKHCFELYDVVRIDHFRGFDEYYAIPYGDPTAERGKWCPGPGIDLFNTMKEVLGEQAIIAEDLGYITDTVRRLLAQTGFPNMKVLQFAFDYGNDSDYLIHHYPSNCVVYTGTHDNETTNGWYENQPQENRAFTDAYAGIDRETTPADAFIRLALISAADTAVIPMQDYLGLGNEARINHPSTLGGINWQWRLKKEQLTDELAVRMNRLSEIYLRGRK